MEELIKVYQAEIKSAEESMLRFKHNPLIFNVAEQQKTTYQRVIEDLEQLVKNNGVLGDVIISTQCAFCTTITDFENTKIETCDSCKDRGY
jgi:hypothetical protein